MAPAYRTPPRAIRLPNGSKMQHGQIIKGVDTMKPHQMQRSSMHADKIGRDPRRVPKNSDAPIAISPGMKRQTPDSVFTGPGQTKLDDEPNLPIKSHAKPIPIHGGMTEQQVNKFHSTAANHPTVILQDAANLGKPPSRKA
jgi:hypothetical protein